MHESEEVPVPVDVVLYCRGVLMGQQSAVVIMRPRQ
jgi:hypothetical protein